MIISGQKPASEHFLKERRRAKAVTTGMSTNALIYPEKNTQQFSFNFGTSHMQAWGMYINFPCNTNGELGRQSTALQRVKFTLKLIATEMPDLPFKKSCINLERGCT
jgi:hypothetical protein